MRRFEEVLKKGRGEYTGQNSFRNGYANGLGAIRGGGGFLYYFLAQTFFLGGTSPKCPSYHSLVLHPPTPYTLSPLLKGGEGRGEGGSYTRMPCPFGALLVTLDYFLAQTFFLGGTSPKCPSYHSETRYRKLGITSPHSLHPLPPS